MVPLHKGSWRVRFSQFSDMQFVSWSFMQCSGIRHTIFMQNIAPTSTEHRLADVRSTLYSGSCSDGCRGPICFGLWRLEHGDHGLWDGCWYTARRWDWDFVNNEYPKRCWVDRHLGTARQNKTKQPPLKPHICIMHTYAYRYYICRFRFFSSACLYLPPHAGLQKPANSEAARTSACRCTSYD